MIEFPSYSRQEIEQRARDLLRTRRRGADVSFGSDYDLWARILGALSWSLQKHAESALRLLDPTAAFGAYLAQYALEHGIGRDATEVTTDATHARGEVILLSATGEQTQLAGSVLRHADGTEYTLDDSVTTPETAEKTLRAGHLSGRRRLFQGHVGGGFVNAAAGEVYLATGTGEYCALRDVDNAVALKRYLFDLYNPLDAPPAMHDAFVQQLGVVANVTARTTGVHGNKDAKDVLTLVSPAGTFQAEAYVLHLFGGAGPMAPAQMQQALRDLYRGRAAPATMELIRAIALSYPRLRIHECFVSPATHGIGTYTIVPIAEDGQYLGANERADLVAYVRARLSPLDKLYAGAVYEVIDTRIDYVNVSLASIYAPDWRLPNESVRGVAVTGGGGASIELATVDMVEGNRIIVTTRGSAGAYLVQRRVTAIAGNTLTLDEPLPFPPDVANAFVTPGGPLGQQLIDAVYLAYAGRAPSGGSAGRVRYPIPAVTDDPQGILKAISSIEGVIDAAFTAGTAPSLPDVAGIGVPGLVLRMYA